MNNIRSHFIDKDYVDTRHKSFSLEETEHEYTISFKVMDESMALNALKDVRGVLLSISHVKSLNLLHGEEGQIGSVYVVIQFDYIENTYTAKYKLIENSRSKVRFEVQTQKDEFEGVYFAEVSVQDQRLVLRHFDRIRDVPLRDCDWILAVLCFQNPNKEREDTRRTRYKRVVTLRIT